MSNFCDDLPNDRWGHQQAPRRETVSAFNNRAKDDLLAEIHNAYECLGLSFAEFMVVSFEILAYFVEYTEHE